MPAPKKVTAKKTPAKKIVAKKAAASPAAVAPDDEPRRRSRLAPEARADQILDVAARLLLEDGFTEVSMERLGREAGISKALVYNYFPSRNDLLCALLRRETERNREAAMQAVKASGDDFAELLRSTTRLGIVNQRERGALLSRLWAEPAVVRSLADDERRTREAYVEFFSRKINKIYGIPMELTRGAVVSLLPISGAAGAHFANSKLSPDEVTELCVTMMLGSLEALGRKFGGRR